LEANIPAEENIKEIPWAFHRYTSKIHLPASSRGAESGHQQRKPASSSSHHGGINESLNRCRLQTLYSIETGKVPSTFND
jgi:hypothetical protein